MRATSPSGGNKCFLPCVWGGPWEDICQFFRQFLEWKLCMDASEFTQFETLQIFLLKIDFSKWQRWLYFRYFL